MTSDLLVSVHRGRTLLQVHALEDGIFSEFALDLQDGLLPALLPFQPRLLPGIFLIRKQIQLYRFRLDEQA